MDVDEPAAAQVCLLKSFASGVKVTTPVLTQVNGTKACRKESSALGQDQAGHSNLMQTAPVLQPLLMHVQAGWNGQARARPRGQIDLQARETADDIDLDSSDGRTFHVGHPMSGWLLSSGRSRELLLFLNPGMQRSLLVAGCVPMLVLRAESQVVMSSRTWPLIANPCPLGADLQRL